MATNYTKTDNFSLNLYGDNDPADLRDGYNGSMRTIDDTLEKHLNRIETLEATDTHDAEVLKALGADTVDNATASKTKWDQAVTDATTAITDATTNNGLLAALGADTVDNATTAKTKWNQAATDATANKKLLAALGADTVDNATAAKAKWDDVYSKTESDARYAPLTSSRNLCVGIGDSYFAGFRTDNPTTDSMFQIACDKMGLISKNFAEGGAGYKKLGNNGGTTFLTQIKNAASSLGSDKDKVRYVIIGGGRNDDQNLPSEIVTETIQTAQQNFPQAKIIIIPMMYDNNYLLVPYFKNYCTICNAADAFGTVSVIRNAFLWGTWRDSLFTDIHPNTTGSKEYGEKIAQSILTTNSASQQLFNLKFDTSLVDTSVSVAYLTLNGTNANCYVRCRLKKWAEGQIPFQIDSTASPLTLWWKIRAYTDTGADVYFQFNGITFKEISASIPDNSFINLRFDFMPFSM